ncbi:hybrid sensor histidine kinase/response regulator transcription factor [Galbibacter pacificus]|uniref:histidine kinase n=1 Tax=Galbibacter pacificus TaxID=2996052 RepID=A0ABT6FUX6_9FLAO|nr:hybrid sensor histidine kinase/response regulator transcription factor [Galbibacter pacificus]MDG3583449.1 two-component regulator propeller domain-containing protein [Galbibacter pacificus]MDG3587074.1 ATP-binding protein [Galbibacter pacificus]
MKDIPKVGIYSINQDDYGFIWIGTNGAGLYRYDGLEYDSYKYVLNDTTSLSSSVVYCTYLDSQHRFWVGTEQGLNLYDSDKDQFKRISNDGFGLPPNTNLSIRSLKEDKDGNLFIGTFGRGLYKMKFSTKPEIDKVGISKLNGTTPITILAIQMDEMGKLYAATNLGVQEYDAGKNMLKPSVFANGIVIKDGIHSLAIDEQDNIWVGSYSKGLYKINNIQHTKNKARSVEHYPISKNPLFSLTALHGGTVLCGTENDGLFHVDGNGNVINHYITSNKDEKSLLVNSIWSLFEDRDRKIWLGYYNKGIAVYDRLYDKFEGIESLYNNPNSLHAPSVTSISKDMSGKLWIGMDGGGIDIVDNTTKQFTHINTSDKSPYTGLTSNYIQTIYKDSQNNTWVASWDNGIYLLKNGSKNFINYNIDTTNGALLSNTIVSIDEDSKGNIWIGTFHNGLHSYNPSTGKFTNYNSAVFEEYGLDNSDVWKVLVDHQDNIWLGATHGLFKIKKQEDGEFQIVSMREQMQEAYNNPTTANHVLSLYEGKDKTIWIGTKGAGLAKYDVHTGTFKWYNKLTGLPLENICGIIESDEGDIWLTGNSGIVKMNSQTNEFVNYSVNDGLLSNDFNMNATYKCKDGEIYLGGYGGVDYFNPEHIETNRHETILYLSDLRIFNKRVLPTQPDSPLSKVIAETDSIALTNKQPVFTIEYSGINYTRPEKNEYAYYLAGYEDTWNYVGNAKSATYTNLDPGNYTFKLKSSNNDGVWNTDPLELKITILPPWWKTNWALFGYIALFFIGLYVLNKMTQSRIREKQIVKYEKEKRQQEKDLNEKKFQFFTNISHEFRTPLTLIMNPLQDIINNESVDFPKSIREKHNIIHKNTARLHRLVNELLDFRKLELNKIRVKAREFNLVTLANEVLSYFKEEAHAKNIAISMDTDENDLAIWADESMLEKIIFNVISNAFKATPNGGTISVSLRSKDDLVRFPLVNENYKSQAVEIIISDTGIGIAKEQVEKMFERFYQVEGSNKMYFSGTGIGLEVVQSFVELHKGKVEVESELEKGTVFKIILPKGKGHFKENEIYSDLNEQLPNAPKYIEATMSEEAEDECAMDGQANFYTLLLVEDNPELRNYLKNELKGHYKVVAANNGKEGLQMAKEVLPDVIITDVIMPEMNGFDFCKYIKTDIRTSHIPLLMLTAKAKIDDRIDGIEIGADAYMVKPFDMRLLKLRLSQLITSRQLIFNKYFSAISDVPSNVNTTSLDKEFIQKALNYINKNISEPDINVESLASHLNLSRSQVYRKLKALTGQTANEFIRNIRLHKAKALIQAGNNNISEVSYAVGFSSSSYFTKCFKACFGMLPTQVEEEVKTK